MASGDLTGSYGKSSEKHGAVFDGVDDYVDVGDVADFNHTICGWFKLKPNNDDQNLFRLQASGGLPLIRVKDDDNYRLLIYLDTTNYLYSNSDVWEYDKWFHVCFYIADNSSDCKIYVNGVDETGSTTDGTMGSDVNYFSIGDINDNRPVNGSINEVMIFNRALSATEVEKLYNNGNITKGLVGYWKLKDDYKDYSGFGNDSTNNGTFLLNTLPNQIKADVSEINLGATTDQVIAVPMLGTDAGVKIIGVEREA